MKLLLTGCGVGVRGLVVEDAAAVLDGVTVQNEPGDDIAIYCDNEDAVWNFRREVKMNKEKAEENQEDAVLDKEEVIEACEFVITALDDEWENPSR